jgi:Ca-activated chloride channel family protein
MLATACRPRGRRRGAMLPLIAILLPMLLIFLGFAVDLAYMQTTRMELQAAADSASRAGATRLSATDDANDARAFATQVAGQNTVAGSPLGLRTNEIEVGRSTRDASGKWLFSNGGRPANAVRVTAQRTRGSSGGPVGLFFGALIGTPTFQPVQTATASFLNVDVCLVLDRSTSMKQGVTEGGSLYSSDSRFCRAPNAASRWTALDSAVGVFLDELADTDADEHVAICSYSCDGCGFSPSDCGISNHASSLDCNLSGNLTHARTAMNRLTTSVWNGHTYIEAGLREGLVAITHPGLARTSAERMIILLTDGRQNVGNVMNAARACSDEGIVVHTITFADVADQALMRQVADETGGQHFHAPNAAALRAIFRELAAQTARLTD